MALSTYMGRPIVGSWDPMGLIACAGIAVGGLVIGAWGMARRDIAA